MFYVTVINRSTLNHLVKLCPGLNNKADLIGNNKLFLNNNLALSKSKLIFSPKSIYASTCLNIFY